MPSRARDTLVGDEFDCAAAITSEGAHGGRSRPFPRLYFSSLFLIVISHRPVTRKPELPKLPRRDEAVLIQSPGLVVLSDHFAELAPGQRDALGDARGQSLAEQPRRKPIVGRLPSFSFVEQSLRE